MTAPVKKNKRLKTEHKPKTQHSIRAKMTPSDYQAILRYAVRVGIDVNDRGWSGDLLRYIAQMQRQHENSTANNERPLFFNND